MKKYNKYVKLNKKIQNVFKYVPKAHMCQWKYLYWLFLKFYN